VNNKQHFVLASSNNGIAYSD